MFDSGVEGTGGFEEAGNFVESGLVRGFDVEEVAGDGGEAEKFGHVGVADFAVDEEWAIDVTFEDVANECFLFGLGKVVFGCVFEAGGGDFGRFRNVRGHEFFGEFADEFGKLVAGSNVLFHEGFDFLFVFTLGFEKMRDLFGS